MDYDKFFIKFHRSIIAVLIIDVCLFFFLPPITVLHLEHRIVNKLKPLVESAQTIQKEEKEAKQEEESQAKQILSNQSNL